MIQVRCMLVARAFVAACPLVQASHSSLADMSEVAEAGECETELTGEHPSIRGEKSQARSVAAAGLRCGRAACSAAEPAPGDAMIGE